jgi:hypothetical protein
MFEFVTRHRSWILTIAATADVAMVSAVIYFGWHYLNCGV